MKNVRENFNKPFKALDIAVYIFIAALVTVLFFAFAPKKPSSIAEVLLKGECVLKIDLETKTAEISDSAVEKKSETVFVIKSEKGFNEITVDYAAKTLSVTDSDCAGKECVFSKLSGGAIVCVPHSLVVRFSDSGEKVKVG